jgi:hypothetical protein
MAIAILSTLISSIALLGVAMSLLLQARQLRTSQIQATRAAQIELIKFALDNPAMTDELAGPHDSATFVNDTFRNWYVTYLSLGYENRALSKSRLQSLVGVLLEAESSRRWWAAVRRTYDDGATSRREREFFSIVDGEFQRVSRTFEAAENGDVPPDATFDSCN